MYIYDRKLSGSQSRSYVWENEGLGELSTANKWLKLFPDAKRSKADFLIDGESYFESVIWAIETAKTRYDYIYIAGWMLDIDFQLVKSDKNKTLFKLLKDRAERGVEVRILVWDNLISKYAKLHNDAILRLNQLPNTLPPYTFFLLNGDMELHRHR